MSVLDDIKEFLPQDPSKGPPIPEILNQEWPQGVKELFNSLPGNGKRYAAGSMASGRVGPLEAVNKAKIWLQDILP